RIERTGSQVRVFYEQDEFVFPSADVALLEIAHSSAEELARFIWNQLYSALDIQRVLKGVVSIEISVAEGPGQAAHFRQNIGA
ncbi:MAG TPA: hypothetical protein VNU00_06885, partial [Candidatus Binataceae bacterium]|nr:hypothetical protein [Candidatus Binataceae bacterium]